MKNPGFSPHCQMKYSVIFTTVVSGRDNFVHFVIVVFLFCFCFGRVMHVLSLCILSRKKRKTFKTENRHQGFFFRETSLSSTQCQRELRRKCQRLRSPRIQGKTPPLQDPVRSGFFDSPERTAIHTVGPTLEAVGTRSYSRRCGS